jgi:ribonuclease Z
VITPDAGLGPARPGRQLVLTGDTAPSPSVVQAAYHADVLVHEATFGADEADRARETLHATAAEAAEVARLAAVKLLALTHVSTRYFGSELAGEARDVFPSRELPSDYDVVEVPFPERGEPRLVKNGARPVSSAGTGTDGAGGGGG